MKMKNIQKKRDTFNNRVEEMTQNSKFKKNYYVIKKISIFIIFVLYL